MIGLSIAIPLAYFGVDGGLIQLVLVLVVFCIVQVIEGYVLTPKIMGEKTGLHPMRWFGTGCEWPKRNRPAVTFLGGQLQPAAGLVIELIGP